MKNLTLVALGAAAIASGCSSSSDNNGGITSSALGYYGKINTDTEVTSSGSAAANLQINDDDSVTVQITEGPDAGQTATFYADGDGGYTSDDVDSYLEVASFDDPAITDNPVVALIETAGGGDSATFTALRSTDGMTATSEMPVTGTATYSGRHMGGYAFTDYSLALPTSDFGYNEGSFNASVDFGAGQLAGSLGSPSVNITFDATISGSEFKSNSIGIDLGAVDQATSAVEGAFYGSGAEGIAGTYMVNRAFEAGGGGAVGAFIGDRN